MKSPEGYKTRQRETVERCLKENADRHLTVDDIVGLLKSNGSDVGRTTVYRTLEKMVGENKVRRYSVPQGDSACFQYINARERTCEHFHLKCNSCGRLLHMECGHFSGLAAHIAAEHGFKVDNFKTVLYGVCKDCQEA